MSSGENPTQLQRTGEFYVGLFFSRPGRENQGQLTPTILSLRKILKIHEGVEYFELRSQPCRLESLPRKTTLWPRRFWRKTWRKYIFCPWFWNWPAISSTHPARTDAKAATASYGKADRVLVENNFGRDNVCHMAIKVFCSIFTCALLMTLLDDSNLNAFQTLWPRLNILRLVDRP